MSTEKTQAGKSPANPALLRSMESHWKVRASAEEIAQEAHLSRFHFQRVFRDNTGESPGRMRRRLLLERAAYELRTTLTPVTTVALDANYRSLEGFGRAFKREFGLSPLAYRRAAQQIRLLPSASGVHYDPRSQGICSTLPQGKRNMDLIDRLLESDYQSKRTLFEQARLLTDAQLNARLAFRFAVLRWAEPAGTLRDSLGNLVGNGWMDELFRGMNFTPTDASYRHPGGASIPEMQARFESYHEAFRTFVRKVRDENLWDFEWVDEGCTPPETFAVGRVIDETLTGSIANRVMLHRQMEQFGFDSGIY